MRNKIILGFALPPKKLGGGGGGLVYASINVTYRNSPVNHVIHQEHHTSSVS